MEDQKTKSRKKPALRRQAEKRLQGQEAALADLPPEKIRLLVQELQVHQAELESQNEELCQTQISLEETRSRYSDLYDFAPVSYFTLDGSGWILEANLTAASLLGVERGNLIGKLVLPFVAREDLKVFSRFLRQVMENRGRQSCEVRLKGSSGEVEAHLDGLLWRDAGGRTHCRVTATDISHLRAAERELRQHRDHLEHLVRERTASLEAQTLKLEVQREELLRVTEELEEERARLRTTLEQMPEGVVIAEAPSGKLLLVNRQMSRIFARLLSPEDGLEFLAQFQAFYPGGRPLNPGEYPLTQALTRGQVVAGEEIEIVGGDGVRRTLWVNASPLRDRLRRTIGGVATFQDITAHKQAEAEIRRLASFPRLNVNPVLEVDTGGVVTFCNQAGLDAVHPGGGPEAFLPEDLDDILAAALEKPEEIFYREVRVRDAVYGEDIAYVEPFKVIRIYATDITARKRFEEALRNANAQLSALVENSPLAIMQLDEEGTILSCNPAGEGMFGWSAAELVGQKIPMVPSGELEIVRDILRRVSQGERFTGLERRRVRKDGSQIDLSVSVAPMYDEAGAFTGIVNLMEDITPRKTAEAALRDREAKYRAVIETSDDGFCIADMAGRFLEFNDAFVDLLGYSREELLAMSIPDIEAYKTPAEVAAAIEKVRREGHVIFETRLRSKDGRIWPAEPNISYWPIAGGRVFFFVRDITGRKAAEEALRQAHDELEQRVRERTGDLQRTLEHLQFEMEERLTAEEMLRQSEARFRSVFEQSPVGAVIVDQDLRFQRANLAFCQIIGYTPEELASMTVADISHPGDLSKNLEAMQRFLTGELDLFRMEERNIRQDGTVIWVDLSVSAINPGDRSVYFLGIVQDITARKTAEKALAQHAAQVSDLYDNAPCGYHSLDPEGRFVQVNHTELTWLGYTREEMLGGMLFADLLTPASQRIFRKNFPGFKERGWVSDLEFDLFRKDGTILPVLLNATAVRDDTGRYLMSRSTMVDITERRRIQAALEAERRRFFDMLEKIPAYVALIGPDCTIPYANREFVRRFGDPGTRLCYEFLFGIDEPCEGCKALEVFKTRKPHIWEWTGPDGHNYQIHDHPFTDADGSPLVLEMGVDISGLKAAEADILRQSAILSAINRVFREFLICETEEELGRTSLTAAEELTRSAFGFIGEVNQGGHLDITAFSDPGWAACQLKEPGQERVKLFSLGMRGLIGEVVTEGRAVIANDTATHPGAAGLPPGHPPVTSYLGVPLRHGGKVIGLIALANKAGGGYTQADQEAIESLSVAIVEGLLRFRAETRVAIVNRLYLFLSQVNEAIVRVQDQAVLFQEICRIAVEEGRFKMAWVGMVDAQDNAVKAVAQYGLEEGYLERITISFREGPESSGPTGTAVREVRSDICNDIANDPRMAPWREEALKLGYRSSGAFPLRVDGKVVGSLTMYAGKPEYFTGEEVSLLESLANDVSFAMESLERDALRRQAEAALKTSEERLRDLTSRLINAQEAERKRLAIELHDDLGQSLMVLKLQVRQIEKLLPLDQWQARENCQEVLDYINEVVENVRRLSRDLMPPILKDLGLGMALKHILEYFCKHHELECSWKIDEIQGMLAEEQEVIIYRIFQESLTNISKHARATRVTVAINESPGSIRFVIEDNGAGFNRQALSRGNLVEAGLGLASMEERTRMLNGTLEIWSREGQGTRITLVVPLGVEKV